MHAYRFPGETPAYRAARDELLHAELCLRRQVEEVAALRRKLPPGGPVPEDYLFEEDGGHAGPRQVRLGQLFAPDKPSLVVYSYMFGPNAEQPCRMCTSFLDGLEGNAQHIEQRVNLVVVAKAPIQRIRKVAEARGWRRMRLLSSGGSSFNRDYHAETSDGSQVSIIHVFAKGDGGVRHTYSSELGFLPADEGQDTRHIDLMWPLWQVLDLTPEGRGATFRPRLSYG